MKPDCSIDTELVEFSNIHYKDLVESCSEEEDIQDARAAGTDSQSEEEITDHNGEQDTPKFTLRLYKRRWFVLASYCFLTISNLATWFSFSSISNIMQKYYKINLVAVNWFAIVYSLISVILMFPIAYLLKRTGLALIMVLAAVFNALGCSIVYIGYSLGSASYGFMLTGRILNAVSTAAYIFLPSKLAAVWFGEKERATATSIAISADSLGLAMGYLLPPFMIKNSDSMAIIGNDLGVYLLMAAIQAVVTLIYICLAVKDKPKTPPCFSEWQKDEDEHQINKDKPNDTDRATKNVNFAVWFGGYRVLRRNRSFHVIAQINGLIFGTETLWLIALNDILIPRFPGYEPEIGTMGMLGLVIGIPTNVLVGVLLDRTRAFKKITLATTSLTFFFTGLFTIFFFFRCAFYTLFVTYVLTVAVFSTYYTTSFDHCSEMTYPVSEARSGVILLWIAQVYSLIMAQIGSYIIYNVGATTFILTMLGFYFLSFLITFAVGNTGPRTKISLEVTDQN
eukprot:Seg1556.22 transcript_id=Seg1556.22/GoldUCD/mRNA.D3Y31 product="Feline leukemia virus subgroup C receptor-related protein 2" protein_id=Seg1556.22/GoldUCD/D3Y31